MKLFGIYLIHLRCFAIHTMCALSIYPCMIITLSFHFHLMVTIKKVSHTFVPLTRHFHSHFVTFGRILNEDLYVRACVCFCVCVRATITLQITTVKWNESKNSILILWICDLYEMRSIFRTWRVLIYLPYTIKQLNRGYN